MDQTEFNSVLTREFSDTERSRQDLSRYFAQSGNRFTGSLFERLCDVSRPNIITERDLLAVGALSVEIPIRAALWILSDDGAREITGLLEAVDTDTEMWHEDSAVLLSDGGPLWKLWDLMFVAHWPEPSPSNDMGRTKISKLLATKRPRLSPILDSVITGNVFPGVRNHWEAFRCALLDEHLRGVITEATDAPGIPENICLLRRIDAVLWLRHRKDA